MRSRTLRLLATTLAACLASVAAGCTAGDEGGDAAGSGATMEDGRREAAEQVITVNWGAEPKSLDPGSANDTTSANTLFNIMDPLVKLDEDGNPVPSAAESVATSDDGMTVTYTLREGLRWTNGDPVTAGDFEYSWKRTLSPELGAYFAYQFYGIVGAQAYNRCEPRREDCAGLADRVAVDAVDGRTLEVRLTSPQPWFVQQSAHHSFLAVHEATVERFGDSWTEAENIVTNGPFTLERWQHGSAIDLLKDPEWWDAESVKLTRVRGRLIEDGEAALRAYRAETVDALLSLPPEATARLKKTEDYARYNALVTYYFGVNVENIPDVKQRRAMALAIPRQPIIDNVARADQTPATGFTPVGMPGYQTINPDSPWLPPEGDLERARKLMREVASPKQEITLYTNDSAGHREIAVRVRAAWKELGIETAIEEQEFQQYLDFLGPPPNRVVDTYRLGWIGDFVDAINFLELWTCESRNNSTNYCNKKYDALIEKARRAQDDGARFEIYREAEDILFGAEGDLPVLPVYYYTYQGLERESINDSFELNLLGQVDLTEVVVTE